MKTQEVADHLKLISQLKSLNGETQFAIAAYERAAKSLNDMVYAKVDIATVDLNGLAGFGDSIKTAIRQYLATGSSSSYQALATKFPPEMLTMTAVTGIGPKKALKLFQQGYHNFGELCAAAVGGKLDAKLQEAVLTAMNKAGRLSHHIIRPVAEKLLAEMMTLPEVQQASLAGSIRRKTATSKDIDIVCCVTGSRAAVFGKFLTLGKTINVGPAKSSIHVEIDGQMVQSDLWVGEPTHYGALLAYATGSKDHNIRLRKLASERGWLINEYGIHEEATGKVLGGQDEGDLYRLLGIPYVEPWNRVS